MAKLFVAGILFLVITSFLPNKIFGQTDSLLNLIKVTTNEAQKFELYIELGNEFRSTNVDSAIYYHQFALERAASKLPPEARIIAENELAFDQVKSQNPDEGKTDLIAINDQLNTLLETDNSTFLHFQLKRCLAINNEYLGIVLRKQDSLQQAVYYFEASIDLALELNDLDLQAEFYADAAQTYYMMGLFPKSLEYCLKNLEVNEKRNDRKGVASSTGNAGILFKEMGDYDKALTYFKSALQISQELGNKRSIAINFGNIGVVYDHLKQYDLAFEHYSKAAEMHKELGSNEGLIYNYNNIGLIYQEQGNYEKAIEYFNQSFDFSKEVENNYSFAHTCIYLAGTYAKLKQFAKAQAYLDMAGDISERMGALDLLQEYYELQSEVYSNTGHYSESLDNYKKYVEVKDSLINEKNLRKVIQLESNLRLEKRLSEDSLAHAKELLLQEAETDQRKAELRAAKYLQYTLIGGLLLLAVSVFLMNKRFQISRKQNRIITAQKEILQSQKIQVESQKETLEAKQKEIVDSITYAQRIQGAILPSAKLVSTTFPDSFILYKPKDIVAGDFYWLEKLNDLIFIAAADCTGHGVPGAMVSVICHNALNRCIRELEITEPGKILDTVKKMITDEFEKSDQIVQDGMDIALCSVQYLNEKDIQLKYAGAHNSLLLLKDGANEVLEISANKQPVGKYFIEEPFTTHTLNLKKNDRIYFTTDGYYDQFGGAERKKFKSLNFRNLLLQIKDDPMPVQLQKLDQVFEEWRGSFEQIDDVCVVGVRL